MSDILDPFHRELAAEIAEEIEREKNLLATGSAKGSLDGSETVAERYAATVGYIRGLVAALGKAEEIEKRQMGAGVRPAKVQYE